MNDPRNAICRVASGRLILPALLVLLCLPVLGAGLARAEDDRMTRRQKFLESLKVLSAVYERVYYNYVDEMEAETITEAGISGIIEALDEHSQYLPPEHFDDLRLSTEGEFGGLGITISIRDHYPTVISPIEGTPAYYMGIQGGDQIIEIEGESAYDFSSRDAVELLRGPPGTQVNIKIRRAGIEKPLPFTITRDIIKVESVPYAFELGDIGYIRIQNFSKTTAQELREKLEYLQGRHVRGLILDLRYNPGGLLDSAKDVAELFLPEGELLVFTRGRLRTQNVSYFSEPEGPIFDDVPMIILVNGSSASGSEIVAAALQDHDAALVAGKTTFGKGSVQTVFQLAEDRALKLTTARYFTPSGRSIHKDRSGDEEADGEDEGEAAETPDQADLEPAEQEVPRHEKEQYSTDMGRVVFGGGGITPDVEIEQALMEDFEIALERDGALFSFASVYAARHDSIERGFQTDEATLAEFHAYLAGREKIDEYLADFDLALSDSLLAAHEDYLRRGIRREVMRRQFGPEAAYRVAIEADAQLHEALALFERATTLAELFGVAAEWNEEQLRQAAAEAETAESPVGN